MSSAHRKLSYHVVSFTCNTQNTRSKTRDREMFFKWEGEQKTGRREERERRREEKKRTKNWKELLKTERVGAGRARRTRGWQRKELGCVVLRCQLPSVTRHYR